MCLQVGSIIPHSKGQTFVPGLKTVDIRKARTADQESEDCGELLMSSDAEGLEPPVLPHD